MIPSTVPNRPMNGAFEPSVARNARLRSRRSRLAGLRALQRRRDVGVCGRAEVSRSAGGAAMRSCSSARMSATRVRFSTRWFLKYQSRSRIIATLTTLSATSNQNTQPAP